MTDPSKEIVARHQGHFDKIFQKLDDLKEELRKYVKAPTFVVSLITTTIAVFAITGWIYTALSTGINQNQQNILEIAKGQVKHEIVIQIMQEKQDKYFQSISDLIAELRKSR